MDPTLSCKYCHSPITPAFYFCPNCGKKLKEKIFPLTIWKQIGYFTGSFFLPPIGFWWALKLLRRRDAVGIRVALMAIIITIVSLALTAIVTINTVNEINATLNKQLNGFGNLGY